MGMNVTAGIMVGALTPMTMDVKMGLAVSVPVAMEMKAGMPQPKKDLSSQEDQHHADNAFQGMRQVVAEAKDPKRPQPRQRSAG